MKPALVLAALSLVSTFAPLAVAQKQPKLEPGGVEVGQIAPPIGQLLWVQLGGEGASRETNLLALRGQVVIVADYGYYCSSCTKVGVPTLNALRAANEGELRTIHLTAYVGDDDEKLVEQKGEELGLAGPVGIADVDGQSSPYLNMGVNGNLTYAYVIGRHGGIVWKGDPSRKREEYVAAVGSALHAVPCEPLPAADAFGKELAPALREYVLGNFVQADLEAQTLLKKLAAKSGPETERARTEAGALIALVETTRKKLMDELEKTGGAKDAEQFQRALTHVRRVFPKGPEADRASQLEMYVAIQSDQGPACRRWAEWYALEAARPATFPAEKDGPNAKYARELAKYARQPDVPGLERAKQWLAVWEKVAARK